MQHTPDLHARGRAEEEVQAELQAELLVRNIFVITVVGTLGFVAACWFAVMH